MAFAPTPIRIELTDEERRELERMARGQALEHRTVVRAQVVLGFADGKTVSAVARQAGRQRRIVRKWADRFVRKRLRGLEDAPRSGRPARFSPSRRAAPGEVGMRAA
jgi:transposase